MDSLRRPAIVLISGPDRQPAPEASRGSRAAVFSPPVDVAEALDGFEIRVELAGADPSQIEITVGEDARTVLIRGVRHASHTPQSRYLNLEVQYGQFAREVQLPREVAPEAAEAVYGDGFLVVRLPKRKPDGRKRRIAVEQG